MELSSIIILVAVAVLSSIAGYWTRIAQKLEDRRDQIYLTDLPAIYSNILAFANALILFKDGGAIDQLNKNLDEASNALKEKINSGHILIFKEQIHEKLCDFLKDAQALCAVVASIQDIKDSGQKDKIITNFRASFSKDMEFPYIDLSVKPKEILEKNESINKEIGAEFKKYKAYSWQLTLIIAILGAIVVIIEIVKGIFNV